MQQAKRGDTVQVHYTGKLEDGTVFDSSGGGNALSFTIGAGEVIPGFEHAVVGMQQGDRKTETIAADRAYGAHREELIFTVSRNDVPQGMELAVGDILQVGFPGGETGSVQVAELSDRTVTLDANHPLAGKTLIFDLELVGIDG
ncbi:MAG TPA: peptidylprolyl isomerase [Thermoanaerobaculia bacterium]|nr:peptidylprolyl isomerase [Thermoanaerobaculia bacterium]